MNIDLLNPRNLGYISDFKNTMLSLPLIPHITSITRYQNNNSGSIIDHIWSNHPDMVFSSVIKHEISDHVPTTAIFKTGQKINSKKQTISCRPFKKRNVENYKNLVSVFVNSFETDENNINPRGSAQIKRPLPILLLK